MDGAFMCCWWRMMAGVNVLTPCGWVVGFGARTRAGASVKPVTQALCNGNSTPLSIATQMCNEAVVEVLTEAARQEKVR